jgi:hypothetical protein
MWLEHSPFIWLYQTSDDKDYVAHLSTLPYILCMLKNSVYLTNLLVYITKYNLLIYHP